jgi:hypothetical protein
MHEVAMLRTKSCFHCEQNFCKNTLLSLWLLVVHEESSPSPHPPPTTTTHQCDLENRVPQQNSNRRINYIIRSLSVQKARHILGILSELLFNASVFSEISIPHFTDEETEGQLITVVRVY